MKRRLFTILAAVSLLLFVAVVVLWVRSYHAAEGLRWSREGRAYVRWNACNRKGELSLSRFHLRGEESAGDDVRTTEYIDGDDVRCRVQLVSTGNWHGLVADDFRDRAPTFEWADDSGSEATGFAFRPPIERRSWDVAGVRFEQRKGLALPYSWLADPSRLVITRRDAVLRVRHSVAATVTAVLPLVWTAAAIRRWRIRGRCPSCAYDLRATPDRCPECGGVPAKASA